ncbi:SusC/RagA family TonB-linked outer membrane protein [Mucilaginibacter sp. NFX135]|uniref:SusC/RagA family TonB-linked outer membrane protein n=1 Tax=Mucilaginibacter sp. NFX135 TaxID=3402687 RepID=UPI003AFB765E
MKRNLTISVLVLFCFFFVNTLFAQNAPVKGKVTDANTGEPLIGVSVAIKGTTTGIQTDVNGAFTLQAPPDATLVFTYIGYTTLSLPVNNQNTLTVKLQPEAKALQEVVVVGYGTQRKRDVTGAVASVKGEELAKQPVQTATQALQGKVSGVQVISSGAPNSQPTVRIRGTGTLLAGADPLYVVDGVLTNDIRNINNNDIVNVDILKDASAAAIYGVRAANGVIIITTKQGKSGKTIISYDGTIGFHDASKVVQMANASQYQSYLADAAPGTTTPVFTPAYNGTTNWFGEILRKSLTQSNNVSISGGSDKNTFFFSAGYLTDNGIVINNNFNRINLRTSETFTLSDKVKVSTQISFTNSNTRNVNLGAAYNDAYRAAPIIPAMRNGLYGNTSLFGNVGNPLIDIGKNNDQSTENRLQGNIAIDYKPIKNLTLHSAINTDVNFNSQRVYNYKFAADSTTYITPGGNQRADFSQLIFTRNNNNRYIWDNTATYQQSFGKHSLTILGGFTTERYYQQYTYGSQKGVPANQDLWYLGTGDPTTDQVNNYDPNATPLFGDKFTRISVLGRINYSYAGKYLITANIRDDGSSKFAQANRYAVFPSFGAGWIITEEGFMKNQKVFDLLKLRAGYGKIGNDNIASNLYIVTAKSNIPYFFGSPGSTGVPTTTALGAAISELKNANLKWETTEEYDAALEFGLLNSRLTGEVSYYSKKTKNSLINVQIPAIFGDPNNQYVTNAATISNKGIEAGLNWRDDITKKLRYNVGVNATFNTNRILSLNGGQALPDGGVGQQGFTTLSNNGVAAGSFYVLKAIGIFQTAADATNSPAAADGNRVGSIKYADISGPNGVPDGKIDAYDRVYAGSYQPKVYFGINGGISYSDFDMSFGFSGSLGGKIYNGKKAFRYQATDNIEASYANARYTPSKPSQTDPQVIQSNTPASTYFIESGSYIRLNNLTLGYTLPKNLLGHTIKSLRVYASSQNLFTITGYSGFTPELPGTSPTNAGIETNAYPTPRTVVFGVNLGL